MGIRSSREVDSFSYFLPCNNLTLLYVTSIGLYSEHSIPVDIADRFSASSPAHMFIGLGQRSAAKIAEVDK